MSFENGDNFRRIFQRGVRRLASSVGVHSTLGTEVLLTPRGQALLRVVSDIRCQNWMDAPHEAVSAYHIHTFFPSHDDRLEHRTHTGMEEFSSERRFLEKQSSLATGRYPRSTVACAEGRRCIPLSIFPMVRYTGDADLLPLMRESVVLSDASMIGAIVAPCGSLS